MTDLPTIVKEAWIHREGPAVLATIGAERKPNAIYIGEVQYEANEGFIVADNYFHKTRANIHNGSTGSILFITKEGKSYQIKGPLTYHTDGPVFKSMQTWHNPKHPGVAAVCLHIEEVFCGAEKLL
ncbi:MAG: pyridoxamine 5-phosphate oxidase [Lentisphaerae bacterium RIFOXYA12_FULL_48_11]|nr:MAG: pyridoxamine 5-phosphate oxidase [Lentisphaerae bacterium RIFOXYA12_FULL_48_11]